MDLTHAELLDAIAFAAHKHRDQRRKDEQASPYINHPIALARVLAVEGGVTDRLALLGAVLHDTASSDGFFFRARMSRKAASALNSSRSSWATRKSSGWIASRP